MTKSLQRYNHQAWEPSRRFLRFLLKSIGFTLLVKLDNVAGIENIPKEGPVIILINHIAFIDPIVVLHVAPRNIVPLAKAEVYDYPGVGIFPRIWGVVPIKRDEIDRNAIRKSLNVLNAGECLLVAPEGTRGYALQRGKEGAAYLASRTDAAIVPVAIEGTDGFPAFRSSERWKQSGANIHFGRPFCFQPDLHHARGNDLRKMMDEAMYVLAKMLPENRRGVYDDVDNATQETIEWL
ncbi:MAG: lysophospholipid acyltransferase family protein [Chloroflexota bacterium]|nr:lysophospholipid acyltransferase family protein [Chloroflexota bacterium]